MALGVFGQLGVYMTSRIPKPHELAMCSVTP